MQPQMPCLLRWTFLLWSTILFSPLRAKGNPCLEGQDVFSMVKENSLMGELISEFNTDLFGKDVVWSLTGEDADWFFLEGRNIRLNASLDRVLDREMQGPVLKAALTCFEEDTLQSQYRIMVEILNENDNTPEFMKSTVQPRSISELAEVNTVVLTVKATDADDDAIMYIIDQTSPDAAYFRVDLPNSGQVLLAQPLDYETKTQVEITIYAMEMNTAEKFNTSAILTVKILDGDDQYPQFLPCMPISNNQSNGVCTSPVYTVNITEGEQDIILDFSPGPIKAVDGDRDINSTVSYSILSGADNGRFMMDPLSGEMRLMRGVENRLQTPTLRLRVMAYQRNDPRKYSVTTALVLVVAVNRFPPQFSRAEYRGFVTEGDSHASLVNTYGNTVLLMQTQDRDFADGINPMVHYSIRSSSNHTQFYHITQEGLLIARTNQLQPSQKHSLEVVAVDGESGDMATAFIKVEVLCEGQTVPQGPLGDERHHSSCAVGKAMGVVILGMTVLGFTLYTLQHVLRTYRGLRDPEDRGCVAQGKHPNVKLQWFQLVSHSSTIPSLDEVKFKEDGLSTSTSMLLDSQSIYTPSDSNPSLLNAIPLATPSMTYTQHILPSSISHPSHGTAIPKSTHSTTTSELDTTSIHRLENASCSNLQHYSALLDQINTPIHTQPSRVIEGIGTPTQVEKTHKGTPCHTSLTQVFTPSPHPTAITSPLHRTYPPSAHNRPHTFSLPLDYIHTAECDTPTSLLTPPSPNMDRVGTPPPKPTPGKANTPVLTTPSPEMMGPPGYPEEGSSSTHSPETGSMGDDDCFLREEEFRTSDEDEELVRLYSRAPPTFLITDYDHEITAESPTSAGNEEPRKDGGDETEMEGMDGDSDHMIRKGAESKPDSLKKGSESSQPCDTEQEESIGQTMERYGVTQQHCCNIGSVSN